MMKIPRARKNRDVRDGVEVVSFTRLASREMSDHP